MLTGSTAKGNVGAGDGYGLTPSATTWQVQGTLVPLLSVIVKVLHEAESLVQSFEQMPLFFAVGLMSWMLTLVLPLASVVLNGTDVMHPPNPVGQSTLLSHGM
jgi:hypothetical protein